MATNPTPMDLQTLESARRHLQSLVTSLTSLRRDLDTNEPLPAYGSLLTSTSLIAMHISALANQLSSHADFFATAHATPLTTFPGREQEVLLQQLLRKKLDPAVAEWVGEGEARARLVDSAEPGKWMNGEERRQLWQWASPRAQELARKILVEGAGLGGDDEDDDEEDEEDEDEDEDDDEADAQGRGERMDVDHQDAAAGLSQTTRPIMPLEDICRFISTGAMPTQGAGTAGGIRPSARPGAG